jgi:uncharacterized repeat protein (TIGR03803 family)
MPFGDAAEEEEEMHVARQKTIVDPGSSYAHGHHSNSRVVAWRRAASKYKALYKFSGGKDGALPDARLIFDQVGNLYSTTQRGGAHGGGTVFKLKPNADGSWRESVLYSFCSLTNCGDGEFPVAGLIFDQAGNLYGTTESGGAHGPGTVFQLAPNADGSWRETINRCSI